MKIDLTPQQKKIAAGVIAALLVLGGGGYYYFSQTPAAAPAKASVDVSLLAPTVKSFLNGPDKYNFKDLSFSKSDIYPQLVDYSQAIPFKVPEGRPNPFVPYVAP